MFNKRFNMTDDTCFICGERKPNSIKTLYDIGFTSDWVLSRYLLPESAKSAAEE